MAEIASNDLLQYYKRELGYLRNEGANFAKRYPKVASKMSLHGTESLDPHTERLIESVAFLAARVHQDLDREFPKVANALLENLSPTLTQPTPSMTVAQFSLDPTQGKVTAGFKVPRHTQVYATAAGQPCRFRTAWDTVLWPVQITRASIDGGVCLRLTFECSDETSFAELEIDALRIHLQGDWMVTMPLYNFLASDLLQATLTPLGGASRVLPQDAWREIGYGDQDSVLPLPAHAQPAYGLMQEYFCFPRKFHFFDLHGVRALAGDCKKFDVALTFAQPARGVGGMSADNFALGCTPIINLFSKTSEPILMDHRHYEYLLVADRQRESTTEIHSIVSVTASARTPSARWLFPHFRRWDVCSPTTHPASGRHAGSTVCAKTSRALTPTFRLSINPMSSVRRHFLFCMLSCCAPIAAWRNRCPSARKWWPKVFHKMWGSSAFMSPLRNVVPRWEAKRCGVWSRC